MKRLSDAEETPHIVTSHVDSCSSGATKTTISQIIQNWVPHLGFFLHCARIVKNTRIQTPSVRLWYHSVKAVVASLTPEHKEAVVVKSGGVFHL